MIFDMRTYVCRPGTINAHLKLYEEYGKAPQTKHLGQRAARAVDLAHAEIGGAMDHLALQVRQADRVVVDHAQGADAGGGEVLQQGRAQPASADHQHLGLAQLGLTDAADLRQDDVARVALKLGLGEVHAGAYSTPHLAGRLSA